MYKTEYSIVWKIEDFSFCYEKSGQCLYSPTFQIESLTDRAWGLCLYPRGKTTESANFISCFLHIRGWDTFPSFDVEIKIIGPSGKVLRKLELYDNESSNKGNDWGSSTFISTENVARDARNSKEDSLTVCCKVHGKNSTADAFDDCVAHTKIGVDRQLFKCYARYREGRLMFNTHAEYFKNKYFKFSIASEDNNLVISMRKRRNRYSWFVVACKITLLNLKNYETCSETYKQFFEEKQCTLSVPLAIFLNELKRNTAENQTSMVRCIYLTAEFSYSNGMYTHYIPEEESFQTKTTSLRKDLRSLFYSKKFSDVKLRAGDQIFDVHKNVLAARSPVFAVMFDHGMAETQMGVVDIVDVDARVLKPFLQFLYTDSVDEMDYEVAANLLLVAEKYQVLPLKEKCCLFLKNEISEETVCDILSLANAVNHEYLKSVSTEFIAGLQESVSSPQWEECIRNNKELAATISPKLNSDMKSRKINMCRIN